MKKALFIVNPIAGKGKSLELIRSLEPIIKEKIAYHIELTDSKGAATEIVKQYTSQDDYIVFAVGGDGTVYEVLNGMVGTNSSLAILPTGSGNDFIRSIYGKYTLEELLIDLIEGTDKKIDVIQVGEKHFLNIASVGLDAEVVYNASKYKKMKFIKGDMAYIISLLKTLLGPRGTHLKVIVDGKEICNKESLLLAVANGSFYGGGIHMVPTAKVNDGLADVCLIKETRLRKLVKLVPSLLKAKHHERDEVEMYHAKEVIIEAKDGCKANLDGEIIAIKQLKMVMVSEGITIRVPLRNMF